MQKYKPLLKRALLLLFFISGQVCAQELVVFAGANYSSQITPKHWSWQDGFGCALQIPGYQLGASSRYNIVSRLHVEPSLSLISKGQRAYDITSPSICDSDLSGTITRAHFVQFDMPFTFMRRSEYRRKFNVWFGPYLGFAYSGRVSRPVFGPDSSVIDETFPISFSDPFARLDFGISTSLTFEIEYFVIDFACELGMRNYGILGYISPPFGGYGHQRVNKALKLSLGYRLDL